jgi:hypothetical protein
MAGNINGIIGENIFPKKEMYFLIQTTATNLLIVTPCLFLQVKNKV